MYITNPLKNIIFYSLIFTSLAICSSKASAEQLAKYSIDLGEKSVKAEYFPAGPKIEMKYQKKVKAIGVNATLPVHLTIRQTILGKKGDKEKTITRFAIQEQRTKIEIIQNVLIKKSKVSNNIVTGRYYAYQNGKWNLIKASFQQEEMQKVSDFAHRLLSRLGVLKTKEPIIRLEKEDNELKMEIMARLEKPAKSYLRPRKGK